MPQLKQSQWHEQWEMFQDEELFLFKDWIYPMTLDDFKDKEVLEAGCGGGQHTYFIAPYAKKITAVDLNTHNIAQLRNKEFSNIEFVEADIAAMDLGKQFDIVFSIGVIHHTDNPEKSVENLKKHLKPGGRLEISDMVTDGAFLPGRVGDAQNWPGCIFGALPEQEYIDLVKQAGFNQVQAQRSASAGKVGGVRTYSIHLKALKPFEQGSKE